MKRCPSCGRTYSGHILFCPSDGTKLDNKIDEIAGAFPGQILKDKYEIKEAINSTGKWFVYHGCELATKREIAIKISSEPIKNYENYRILKTSLDEARKISHPGWVKLIDFGRNDKDYVYIVTEYIKGESLREIIKNVPSISKSLYYSIIKQTLQILEIAHQRKIIHQGLCPSKILLVKTSNAKSFVKLIGLGECQFSQNYDTNIKIDVMTPRQANNYTAPEIFLGKKLTATCDIYSVGVIFYELITHMLPFPSGVLLQQNAKRRPPEAPLMRKVKPGLKISRKLEHAILKAIRWDPLKRHKNTKFFMRYVQQSEKSHVLLIMLIFIISILCMAKIIQPYFLNYVDKNYKKESNKKTVVAQKTKITKEDIKERYKVEQQKKQKKLTKLFVNKLEYVLKNQSKNNNDKNMVKIPEGDVIFGYGETSKKYFTQSFLIDDHEVTNQEYYVFLKEMKFDFPKYWNNEYPQEKESFPVVGITWYDAKLYAAWAGKRLPSEIEWEKAIRFPKYTMDKNAKWLWGNKFDKIRANIGSSRLFALDRSSLRKTNSLIFDMTGNVWEWTDSWYDDNVKKDRVIRGGSFSSKQYNATIDYREGFFMESFRNDIGFRCVKTVK